MKILLRNLLTGLYYSTNQTWCAGAPGARVFDSIKTAASVAQELKLETVNVVLRDEEPTCELALPLAVCISDDAGIEGQRPRAPA